MKRRSACDAYAVYRPREGRVSVRMKVRVAVGFLQRLRGLIGSDARSAEPLWFGRCNCVHTFGMTYPLDLAFIAGDRVLEVKRGCAPGRVWRVRGARAVLERPAAQGTWIQAGDEIRLVRNNE